MYVHVHMYNIQHSLTFLLREHFPPAGDGGDTDDNMTASDNVTDGDNDPLDFRSSMGSRDSGTVIEEAPVGGTHDKAAEGLHDISVLKRQRKRFVSKQKTLLRKMTHLKRRAVDLNEVGVAGWMGGCGRMDGWVWHDGWVGVAGWMGRRGRMDGWAWQDGWVGVA